MKEKAEAHALCSSPFLRGPCSCSHGSWDERSEGLILGSEAFFSRLF